VVKIRENKDKEKMAAKEGTRDFGSFDLPEFHCGTWNLQDVGSVTVGHL
jgi:hypothetical protein